jgi:hypothetical protein
MTIELLILGACILAQGPLTETADSIQSPDAVYPKSVITGWQLLEAVVPEGFTPQGYTWGGAAVVVKPAPAPDAAAILAATLRIDAQADEIRNAVLGGRTTEYQAAEADAQAFKAAGYSGTVPPGVKSWLDAKTAVGAGWTAQQCADDILATAASWRAAQDAIRANRLLRKLQVEAATTQAGIDAALAAWGVFTSAVKVELGIPG